MEKIVLQATTREVVGKKVKKHRTKGFLPVVVYGHGHESTPLFVNAREYKKIFNQAGTSALVDLSIDEKKSVKVLLHEPQVHHLTSEPIHADLYAVKMTEKIETAVPIHFINESPAVTELEGNLVTSKDELEIRCLPADLIPAVEVDLSVLKTFDDQIRVSDIQVPGTIEILHDPEEIVVSVSEPMSEEELEASLEDSSDAEKAAVEELGKEPEAEEGADEDKSE